MAPATAGAAGVEPGGGITLRDWGYRDWAPDLLHYRLDTPPDAAQWSLVDAAAVPVPFQIDGDVLSFVAALPRGATRHYRLVRGRAADGALRHRSADRVIEIGNEYFTLQLPAVGARHVAEGMDTTAVPPPLRRWRPRGGPWMGRVRWVSGRRVQSYELSIVRSGPVAFVYQARYRFLPEGVYVCRIAVVAGLPYAEVTEELDGGELRRDNRDFLLIDLHRGASPGAVEVVVAKGESDSTVRATAFATYLAAKRRAQFEVSSFGGSGRPPTPPAPVAEAYLLERLFPAGRWGGLAGGIGVTAGDGGPAWRVAVVPLHVGDWRRAMALNAWGTADGELALALPLDARWAWWHLDTTDEQSPFSTHEHDPAFADSYARRVWGLFFGDHLAHAQDRYGFIGLDRYKEWRLSPPARPARYPRAFVTPAIADQIRADLPRHPDQAVLSRFFVISGRAEDALRHGREFLDWIRQQTDSWRVHGLSHYRQSETLHRAFLAEDALSYAGLPAAMRREIMLHLRLWAHLLAEPDYNPRGAGVHLGNNNMTINRSIALLYFAALLPDDKRYHEWMSDMKEFVRFKLATQTAVDGVWIAAPNYQLYGPTRFLDTAINILRNTGYGDPQFADYHGRTLGYLANLTVADPRFNGLRIIPGMGNSGNMVESVFGLSLRAAGPPWEALLRRMHRLSVDEIGISALPLNGPHHAFNYWSGTTVAAPSLGSRFLPTYGMVFRNGFAGDHETALLFRAGSNWSHWDTDVFNLIVYGRGAPLSPGTGYGYPPPSVHANQAIYHNRVKLVAHDRREIFGRVDAPIRDYALGAHVDYAAAERYYPPELYTDNTERRWRRQVMFVKSADNSDYFVVRDSFPGNPGDDRSWWTWLSLGEADRARVAGEPFPPARTPRNRAASVDDLPIKHGQTLDLLGDHGADTHLWFTRSLSFRARQTFDATVHLPYDRALLDFDRHFPRGRETKTIIEAMAPPGDGYTCVIYPHARDQPPPPFTVLAPGVIRIDGADSTDTIFVGDSSLRYADRDLVFSGRAGAVRVFADRVVLSLASGSGEIGYRGQIFSGDAPFERTIDRRGAPARTELGGYAKTWRIWDLGHGLTLRGEPPVGARVDGERISIEVAGRARVLLLDRPDFIPRPRYRINGREWMATWTDWPDSGFGRWQRADVIALSVPAGKHRLVVDKMRFPPVRTRRFTPLLSAPAR